MAGSIEKRGKNSYRLSCLAGYNLQGRPIKKTKTVHGSKKNAEIKLAKFVADVQNGMFIEGKSLKFSEFTGVRLGELMGLEWQDVDFKTGILAINRSSQYLADKGVFTKTPKTESSSREVAIPDFVISLLAEYNLLYEEQKSLYGELWIDSNRLFVQADGKPMHPSTISKWLVRYVTQIGLPVINFHGLRHSNATLLISQNIDIAVVAARLGHAQITTTFNFYVHPIISHNRKAGNVLENLLLPQKLV